MSVLSCVMKTDFHHSLLPTIKPAHCAIAPRGMEGWVGKIGGETLMKCIVSDACDFVETCAISSKCVGYPLGTLSLSSLPMSGSLDLISSCVTHPPAPVLFMLQCVVGRGV